MDSENNVNEQAIFYSLDDILKEQEVPREGVFEYRGMKFKLAWAYITDDELPTGIEINRKIDAVVPKKMIKGKEANREERQEVFNRIYMDEIVFKRLDKGQNILGVTYITREQYDRLDATVKSHIKAAVLDADLADNENLGSGQDSL